MRTVIGAKMTSVAESDNPPPRWVLEPEDVLLLERVFALEKCPGRELRLQLASRLGVRQRQVQVWFQNKRQRTKVGAKPTVAEALAHAVVDAEQRAQAQSAEMLMCMAGGVAPELVGPLGTTPGAGPSSAPPPQFGAGGPSSSGDAASSTAAPPPPWAGPVPPPAADPAAAALPSPTPSPKRRFDDMDMGGGDDMDATAAADDDDAPLAYPPPTPPEPAAPAAPAVPASAPEMPAASLAAAPVPQQVAPDGSTPAFTDGRVLWIRNDLLQNGMAPGMMAGYPGQPGGPPPGGAGTPIFAAPNGQLAAGGAPMGMSAPQMMPPTTNAGATALNPALNGILHGSQIEAIAAQQIQCAPPPRRPPPPHPPAPP